MLADLADKEAATKLAGRQFRWEAWKALAGITAAVAVISDTVIALENYLHPGGSQQPMFPPGTVITIPAAPAR